MKEGIFTLKTTITNPKPDRRVRDEWLAAAEWPQGGRFSVRRAPWIEENWNRGSEPVRAHAYELRSVDSRFGPSVTFVERSGHLTVVEARGDAARENALRSLVAHLTESTAPDDALLWIFIRHGDGSNVSAVARMVLFRLVREGAVTLAQVDAAIAACDAEEDDTNDPTKVVTP
jgi:hypothetical protein